MVNYIRNIFLFLLFFIPLSGNGQDVVKDLKKAFESAENSADFASKYADEPYKTFTIDSKDQFRDSILLHADPGSVVILKRKTDDAVIFYKVLSKKTDTFLRASEIYLPDDLIAHPEKMADSLLELLKGGTDFKELSDKFGKDGTVTEGGDLGWVKKGKLVPDFEKAVLAHKPGEHFKVFTEKYGWYVGKTTGIKVIPVEVTVIEMVKKFDKKKKDKN